MKYLLAAAAALACAALLIWMAHAWASSVVAEPPTPPPPPAEAQAAPADPAKVRQALKVQVRIALRATRGAEDPLSAIAEALPGIEISERMGDTREGVIHLERAGGSVVRICLAASDLRECARPGS